jgi:hypothetical protein
MTDPYRNDQRTLGGVGLVITILGISLIITSTPQYSWPIICAIGVTLIGFMFNVAAMLKEDKP